MGRAYNLRDLIEAYLDANNPLQSNDYYVQKLSALSKSFGLVLRDETFEKRCMLRLMKEAAKAYHDARSPFQVFMEAPKGIHELYKDHGVSLSMARDQLREECCKLLAATFQKLYGRIGKVVTSEELKSNGFDDSIDPDLEEDY